MKRTAFRVWVLLALLWIALIFVHSYLPASKSRAESGSVLVWVQTILPWMTHSLLRKLAHFAEFAMLGVFLTGAFYRAKNYTLLKPLAFALLIALCDETIQLFSEGRAGMLRDVWLDLSGAVFGTILMWLIFRLRKK